MSQALAGKVAVVTGGTTGTGLAIAKKFVVQGATAVVVAGLEQEQLDKVAEEIGPLCFGSGRMRRASAAGVH